MPSLSPIRVSVMPQRSSKRYQSALLRARRETSSPSTVHSCVGHEPCEDFDRESFVFVLQCFPHVDFVEKQVEETQISLQGSPPSLRRSSRSRFRVQRGG